MAHSPSLLKKKPLKTLAPELFQDMEGKLIMFLQRRGVPAAAAEEVAMDLCDMLARDWAGQQIYVPSCMSIKLSNRNLEIYTLHQAGESHDALARRYNMAVQSIYRIIKQVGDGLAAEKQGDLFT